MLLLQTVQFSNDEEGKFFPVLVTHWFDGEVKTSFIDMLVMNYGTAENTHRVVTDVLEQNRITVDLCVAFVSDNASTMLGKQKGVNARLKKENPAIYGMGVPAIYPIWQQRKAPKHSMVLALKILYWSYSITLMRGKQEAKERSGWVQSSPTQQQSCMFSFYTQSYHTSISSMSCCKPRHLLSTNFILSLVSWCIPFSF